MENSIRYQVLILLIGVLSLAAQEPSVVWPDPPEDPKIRLVETIDDFSAFSAKRGWWERLYLFLSNVAEPYFVQPMGLSVQGGAIAVADPGRRCLYIIYPEQSRYVFIDGTILPDADQFNPIDVAWTEEGLAVTSSSSTRIWLFDKSGIFQRYLEPDQAIGRLTGIAVSGSHFYVVDTRNHVVHVLDDQGRTLRSFGRRGANEGHLNFPTFIALGPQKKIYISDTMNFRLACYSPDGKFEAAIGERGLAAGQLNRPKGISVDDNGRIYVIDTSFDNFQVFDADGTCLLVVGSTGHGPAGLLSPTDLAIEGKYIYVSDTMNKRIQIYEMLYD